MAEEQSEQIDFGLEPNKKLTIDGSEMLDFQSSLLDGKPDVAKSQQHIFGP